MEQQAQLEAGTQRGDDTKLCLHPPGDKSNREMCVAKTSSFTSVLYFAGQIFLKSNPLYSIS